MEIVYNLKIDCPKTLDHFYQQSDICGFMNEIYECSRSYIISMGRSFGLPLQDAEDAAHDIYTKLWLRLNKDGMDVYLPGPHKKKWNPNISWEHNFCVWFKTVIRNKLLNHKKKLDKRCSSRNEKHIIDNSIVSEQVIFKKFEVDAKFEVAKKLLTPIDYEFFVLHTKYDIAYKEIGDRHSLLVNAVKQKVFRARKKLLRYYRGL